MPNWCLNTLTVIGSLKDLERFRKKAATKKTDLSLNRFIPMPKELMRGDDDGWRSWSLKHWGIKWDLSNARLIMKNRENYVYHFDSPWGPPDKALKTIAKMFPTLKFVLEYEEPGMAFYGSLTCANRRVTEEVYEDMISTECANCGQYVDLKPSISGAECPACGREAIKKKKNIENEVMSVLGLV